MFHVDALAQKLKLYLELLFLASCLPLWLFHFLPLFFTFFSWLVDGMLFTFVVIVDHPKRPPKAPKL